MDLDFTEEQEMLRRSVKDFMEKECTSKFVREMETDERGYSPDMWRQFAELGWLAIHLPEEYGGIGGRYLDLVPVYEEMGRALCPTPHLQTCVMAAAAIRAAGSEEQKTEWLTRIANGEVVIAFALTEPSATIEASGVKTTASKQGDEWTLNGTKLFIHWAEQADELLVVARTEGSAGEEGITLFLVPRNAPGIETTALITIATDKQAEVILNNVKVPDSRRIGGVGQGWPAVVKALEEGTVALCSYMVGGAERAFEMATEYSKTRVQFGVPIGSFQAIKHYLADVATELAGAKTLAWEAAWTIDEGLPARKVVSMTKAYVGDIYRHATAVGHQIFGGIGFTLDMDMQLYFRRAKAGQLYLGDAEYHEEIVAQEIGL
jgi:alkylation response protein AidB-like acyl-CoA dehydrogenase